MGARLYLPPDFVIDPGWYPWQQVILRTIKQYGMYINDTGAGDVLFNMQKEGGLQYLTQGANNNWYYAASGSYDPPNFGNVQRCNDRGWDGYGDASTGTFFGCVAHFDQRSSLNRVPLDVWTKLRVAALTVDRALRPSSGPVFGGQSVTLHGTGLQETPQEKVQVRFGDAAPVTGTVAADGTSVTVVTPAHASGPVDVTVTSPVEGQTTPATVTLAGGYNYTTTGSPVFTSKSPPTTAPAGSSYRYKCAVTGDLPLRMRWQAGHRTGSRSTPPPERCRAHLRPAPAWPVSS
jgi:hypothetical protein